MFFLIVAVVNCDFFSAGCCVLSREGWESLNGSSPWGLCNNQLSLCVCLVYDIRGLGSETGFGDGPIRVRRALVWARFFLIMYNIHMWGASEGKNVHLRRCLGR